ncbi:MAG: winged helix-turn-helix transcriptional regulator, partial [Deltaproteobacteria bacterium]|nr:winged helix-turn-helix transcriptional regulator [Deltaproteobacteria bacterium]
TPRPARRPRRAAARAPHAGARPAAPSPVGEREATAVADLFRTLADPTRLRILALLGEGEACVHVICARLGMGQSAVSHQLRLLRVGHLVRPRRVGREIYYAMDDEHVAQLIRDGRRHAGCTEDRVVRGGRR